MADLQVLTVTPEMAEQWLEKNTHNRTLTKDHVQQLARAMANGEWELTYEAIRFNGDGTLIDGQHRLAAIVKSGVPIQTAVVFNLPRTTQLVVDGGKKRRLSDALQLRGEANATTLASALSYLHTYRISDTIGRATCTVKEGLSLLEANPDMRQSVAASRPAARIIRYPHGMGAALHYIFWEIDSDDADDFWTTLAHGTNLAERDPIFLLRRRMEDNAASSHKLQRVTIWAYTVKAWNAWRDDAEMGVLRWRRSGQKAETMPTPQ